jgi:glycosyltransferase involved in cell wall biosynthesis
MKILVISNLYPPQVLGGYERSIADFARILHHRGHQVLVLTSDTPQFAAEHPSRYGEPDIDRCLLLAGRWYPGGTEWFSESEIEQIEQQNMQIVTQQLQIFQPDICLIGGLDFLLPSLLRQILTSVPIAHYVMNAKPGYSPELAPQSPLHRYFTCSNWVTATLQATGYPADDAQTIYPGAAIEDFYQETLPPRDRLCIAYASLVMRYKGIDVLIEALSLLHTLGIEFSATIAGSTLTPEYTAMVQAFVESEGMSDRIQFVGALSRQQLSHLYKTHNVLVFPSRYPEPFGISQIEAMAAGLVLVTSGTGGAGEIVEQGKDGLMFESENPLDLADQLSSLLADQAAWAAIAQQGQQKAITQFSQTRAADQLEAALQELVAKAQADQSR